MTFHVIDYIFPRRCHLCGATLSSKEERYVCMPCLSKLPRTLYHRRPGNPMEMRFAGLFPFERASGHFFYSSGSELSNLMQDLKYRHFRGLGRLLGKVVAKELLTTGFLNDIDFLIPVPMHVMKKARRGYNQTEEIARGISEISGIPVNRSLRASRPHKTQTALTLDQRRKNLRNVFSVKQDPALTDRHLLIIDDVCTTGTTLTAAAEALLDSMPRTKISLLTIGVTF